MDAEQAVNWTKSGRTPVVSRDGKESLSAWADEQVGGNHRRLKHEVGTHRALPLDI